MKLKLKKTLSLLLATILIMTSLAICVSAQEESAMDSFLNYIIAQENADIVEFYTTSTNYTQINNANKAVTRNYRVYTTDSYDMYLRIVELYNLFYAAITEMMEETDYNYNPDIYDDLSGFDVWNTYLISSAMGTKITEVKGTTGMANSLCLGSNGSNYNPCSNFNAFASAAATEVSYVGSIITTTDVDGYNAYKETGGEDYSMVYSLNYNMHMYTEEINGTTYNLRYFAEGDVYVCAVFDDDDLNSMIVNNDAITAGSYPVISASLYLMDLANMITYEVGGGNIYIDIKTGEGIVAGADDTVTDVVIPAQVDGYTITSISQELFKSSTTLKSVVIEAGLETISNSTFRSCSKVETITISGNIGTIDKYAFAYCYNLTSLAITGSVDTIGYKAFALLTSLESITLSTDIGTIDSNAFYSLTSLETIYFLGSEEEWAYGEYFDTDVEIVYNHVCADTDGNGFCDVCQPEAEAEVEAETVELSWFDEIIAAIKEFFEMMLSIFDLNLNWI